RRPRRTRVSDHDTDLVHGVRRAGRPGEGHGHQGVLRIHGHRRPAADPGDRLRAAARDTARQSDRRGREASGLMSELDLRGTPNHADRAFRGAAAGAAAIVLLLLALIAIEMSGRMTPVLERMGLDYFTSTRWSP